MLNDPELTFIAMGHQHLQALLGSRVIKDAKERDALKETGLLQWLGDNVLVDVVAAKLTVIVMKGALCNLWLRLVGNR